MQPSPPQQRSLSSCLFTGPFEQRHWEMHDPEVVKKRENVFDVTMSATYDWNGRSQLASAKGAVKFLGKTKEVRVENYIYDISKS
eukprot:scaffold11525_cov135-Cylindrotheca_fusiformis.AAC.5